MDATFIVYLDDADSVLRQLASAHSEARHGNGRTHWVLVACAPRMTRRIGKWVSHSAREHWRQRWADKLFAQLVPALQAAGHGVTPVLADGPLPELTRRLLAAHRGARVLDLRRPKFAQAPEPGAPGRPADNDGGRQILSTMLGMSAAMMFAAE